MDSRQTRLISRGDGCKANIQIEGDRRRSRYLYHALLDMSYIRLAFLTFAMFFLFNLIFAVFLFCIRGVINVNVHSDAGKSTYEWYDYNVTFSDAFFFSFQSMDTIGYGGLQPNGLLANWTVFVQSFFANAFYVFFTALIFSKLTRPSRLIRQMKFSEIAVINSKMKTFVAGNSDNSFYENGRYEIDPHHQCLSFRFGSMRRSKFCEANLSLLYFERSTVDHENKQRTDKQQTGFHVPENESENYKFIELSYEINEQMPRARSMELSQPFLSLPFTVIHKISKDSPLFGLTKEGMIEKKSEIIAVFGAIDATTSDNFQSWYSYVAEEIINDAEFVPMVMSKTASNAAKDLLCVDYDLISEFHKIQKLNAL